MDVRVTLNKYLVRHNLTAYKLSQQAKGKAAQGAIYALARGDTKRVDLNTLAVVIDALEHITGETVSFDDILERVPEPVVDDETKAWLEADLAPDLEPYEWGPSGKPKDNTVRYVEGQGFLVYESAHDKTDATS